MAMLAGGVMAADSISYNRDIRPLLSDKCFYCHGPDPEHRQAKLRLDNAEGAMRDLGGYQAVVSGKPDASELISRIFTADQNDLMPPPDSEKSLTPTEKDLLRRWIAQGAEYQAHWSFELPQREDPPEVTNAKWVRQPIDAFVLRRLEQEGLKPSPEASQETLIRRVSLDLTGLPPTPAEVEAFLTDESPKAYERVVDRLLNSKRYGERMALVWLNAARYADTHGYQADNEREMWIWRDWVINAYNRNQPFDEFTVEQIAGDMLPQATLEQKIASGFNRNHRINGEGGVIPEEYRTEYVIDRLETTGTVWLGLTVGCARCHSHKFDPISQHEFYSMFAFFNNVPENGRDGRKGNAVPKMTVPIPSMQPRVVAAEKRVADLRAQLTTDSPAFRKDLQEWTRKTSADLAAEKLGPMWNPIRPTEVTGNGGVKFEKLEDGSSLATGANPANPVYTVTLSPGARTITGIRLETLMHKNMTRGGLSRSVNGNFVLTEIELQAHRPDMNEPETLKFARATASYSQSRYPIKNAIDGNAKTGWAILGRKKVEDTTAVFALSEPFAADPDTTFTLRLRHDMRFKQHAIGRFRLSLTSSAKPALEGKDGLPANVVAALKVSAEARTKDQQKELADFYRDLSPAYNKQRQELAAARKSLEQVKKDAVTTVMVMSEMAERRPAFFLNRGQYDQPGEEVYPAIPASLGRLPDGAPTNRLGLAKWLIDDSNPLSARVTVNRYWQMYFGTGLVKTVDDFGAQGEFPSHPDLLDWLATEFIRSGWNIKAMQKLIVTSATYRQATAATAELRNRDPDNRLLARGPRFRLDGPAIRDQALAISGLLREKIGGPSVKPYQPAGLWEDVAGNKARKYTQGRGDDLYRRSMYSFWKRAVAPPTMIIFDAGGRERCDVARRATNTPLQALATLNDVQFVEAARFLGHRMILEGGGSPKARLIHGWRLAVARTPDQVELNTLMRSYQQHHDHFKKNPDAAKELLTIGEKPSGYKDEVELAAYTAVANVLLNLDETVNRE